MIDLDRSGATDPLLDDLNRRRLHAELQRMTLELQHFALELERALAAPSADGPGSRAADLVRAQLQRAFTCVEELDSALAVLSEPECQGC